MWRERPKGLTRAEFETEAGGHLGALYSAALRLTRNQRDAEDLVQETYLRAYRFLGQFQRGTQLKAWLLQILTNLFLEAHRRRRREEAAVERAGLDALREGSLSQAAQGKDPERSTCERFLLGDLLRAIDALPLDFRLPLVLTDLQGLSYREVAEIVGCPVGTVMSRLFRGRRNLRESLRDQARELGVAREPEPADLTEFRRRRAARGGTPGEE